MNVWTSRRFHTSNHTLHRSKFNPQHLSAHRMKGSQWNHLLLGLTFWKHRDLRKALSMQTTHSDSFPQLKFFLTDVENPYYFDHP